MRYMCAVFCLGFLFSILAFSQEHEAANFRLEQLSNGSDQGLHLRSVIYVHKFENWLWLHSLGYRERSLIDVLQKDIHSQTLIYPGFLRRQVGEDWNANIFYSISSSRVDNKFSFQSESTFANLFILLAQDQSHGQVSAWSFGLAIFDRSSPVPVFPVFGYVYQDTTQKHKFRFGYPAMTYNYIFNDKTRLNLFIRFDRENSFSEHQISTNSQNLKNEYLSYERVVYGLQVNQRFYENIFLQYTLGQSDLGQIKILDQDFEEISKEKRDGGVYLSIGLSYIFDLSKMKKRSDEAYSLR